MVVYYEAKMFLKNDYERVIIELFSSGARTFQKQFKYFFADEKLKKPPSKAA